MAEKRTVLAPMPRASATTARIVKPGCLQKLPQGVAKIIHSRFLGHLCETPSSCWRLTETPYNWIAFSFGA